LRGYESGPELLTVEAKIEEGSLFQNENVIDIKNHMNFDKYLLPVQDSVNWLNNLLFTLDWAMSLILKLKSDGPEKLHLMLPIVSDGLLDYMRRSISCIAADR
jgi:hypothetical protein